MSSSTLYLIFNRLHHFGGKEEEKCIYYLSPISVRFYEMSCILFLFKLFVKLVSPTPVFEIVALGMADTQDIDVI